MTAKTKTLAVIIGTLTVVSTASYFVTNAITSNEKDEDVAYVDKTAVISAVSDTTTTVPVQEVVTTTMVTTSEPILTTATTTVTEPTTTTTVTTTETTMAETEATTTTTVFEPKQIVVEGLTVETVSVSCLKVEWTAEENRHYSISCAGYGSAYFSFKQNNVCYITGLRENSEYAITVTPLLNEEENPNDYQCVTSDITGHTQAVEVIQEFPYEEGWTSCFAGERASGLTRQPSSGAIYGSILDTITNTGIRRFENGDYCCAMGLYYGTVGDRFLIELENGQQFTVRICDSKGWADDADGDGIPDGRFHWFGDYGKCIVEFIYDDDNFPACVAYSGSWGYYNWEGMDLCSNILSIKKINY